MAKQNAALDDNNRASMLVADPVTGETRTVKSSASGSGMAVGLADALSAALDSIVANEGGFGWVKLTASGLVFTGSCVYGGFTVLASSSGTVTVYDNTAASGDTPSADSSRAVAAGDQRLLVKPIKMLTGLYVSITGTATVYVLVRAF